MSGTVKSEDGVNDNCACLLEGTKVLDTQVGGHRYGKNGKKMGELEHPSVAVGVLLLLLSILGVALFLFFSFCPL